MNSLATRTRAPNDNRPASGAVRGPPSVARADFHPELRGRDPGRRRLLWLPFSAAQAPLPWIDALFQSASAVCVTGLATIDVGRDLSRAGQVILIVLFQVGGLGILTFSTIFFMLLGRGLASKEQDIMQSAFLYAPRRDLASILKFVILSTLMYESAGTLVLWLPVLPGFPAGARRSTSPSSTPYRRSTTAGSRSSATTWSPTRGIRSSTWSIMGLIVAGGLGFIVHYELHTRIFGNQRRLSVHTRLVLIVTAVLIAGGALLFYVFEQHAILQRPARGRTRCSHPSSSRSPRAPPVSTRWTSGC